MKKTALLALASFFLLFAAQSLTAEESDYYYVNVPIYKIYATVQGYIVVYKVGSTELAKAYLPMRWFSSGGKGDIDYGYGSLFPYMSVYYKAGKFDHIRLHLNADTNDTRWGILEQGADLKGLFDSDDLPMKY